MTKYKVIKYFRWGNLKLNKGQIIIVENKKNENGHSLVSIEHYPEKKQFVVAEAIETMVFLKKIEKY